MIRLFSDVGSGADVRPDRRKRDASTQRLPRRSGNGSCAFEGEAMKPLPHHYDVHLTGGPSGHAQLSTGGVPELRTAPPIDFDGPGDAWSPEHLLLASTRAIARSVKRKHALA